MLSSPIPIPLSDVSSGQCLGIFRSVTLLALLFPWFIPAQTSIAALILASFATYQRGLSHTPDGFTRLPELHAFRFTFARLFY